MGFGLLELGKGVMGSEISCPLPVFMRIIGVHVLYWSTLAF